jgi:hypothetical protein
MRANSFATVLLAVVLAPRASAQTPDTSAIDQLTAKALKHLTTMSRFAYTAQTYTDIEFGKNFGYQAVTGYFGETTGVRRTTEFVKDSKKEITYALWVNEDQLVFTKPGDKGGTVIRRHLVPWVRDSDAADFAAFYNYMGLSHFFFPLSARKVGKARNPAGVPFRENIDLPATTITDETHRGRACFKVTVKLDRRGQLADPLETAYYVDKEHGMVLTRHQKKMFHILKGATRSVVLDVDQVTEVTYGPPTENGLPFPTAVKGWYVWPTGRREPMTDIVFTEFRRYTPTADELDFQKQFGIALPALPPKPGLLESILGGGSGGGRVTRWLVGGVAVTLAVAAVVYLRRRRAAAGAA